MLHRDAVDVARKLERDVRHVHQAVVQTAGAVDGGSTVVA